MTAPQWRLGPLRSQSLFQFVQISDVCFAIALNCMQRGLSDRNAVCPSVKRVHCDKTNESSADILIGGLPYEKKIRLLFRREEFIYLFMVGGGRTSPST